MEYITTVSYSFEHINSLALDKIFKIIRGYAWEIKIAQEIERNYFSLYFNLDYYSPITKTVMKLVDEYHGDYSY